MKTTTRVFFLISILILIVSGLSVTIMPSKYPYINKSEIVYGLEAVKDDHGDYIYDENGEFVYNVSSIQIEIINSTWKKVDNYKLTLRYCREDRYPEAYTMPVIISMKPFEKKTITIEEFRNTCIYNKSYHIESDVNKEFYFDIKDYNNEIEIIRALFIIIPIEMILIIVLVVKMCVESKKRFK